MSRNSGIGKRAAYAAAGTALIAVSAAGLAFRAIDTETTIDEDGLTVTYSRPGHVGTTNDGLTYAPRPAVEFRAEQCDLSPQTPDRLPSGSHLVIPSADLEVPVGISADLSALPDAPRTVRYEESPALGEAHGKTVIAGHVDYTPQTPGQAAGKLSPFGHLHTVGPCDHIYAADAEGQQHEYVLTDMYTVPQDQIETAGIYTTTGDPALVLVTCSGPSVADAGGDGLLAYSYNLILEAVPVEVAA